VHYFRHEVQGNKLTLYPFVCWHLGAKQSDERFIKEMVQRVKDDPLGRWIYLGDAGECITRHSVGSLFRQTMDLTEQLKYFCELTAPIKHKGLFGIRGNHGNRVFKETGLEFDEALCVRAGIPYMGISCFWQLVFRRGASCNVAYDIFTHHGLDSGASMASKVTKARALDQLVMADIILSAHSHICCEIPPKHTAVLEHGGNTADPIRWKTTHEYVCGCAYDSGTGYAEDKGYSPILPAHLAITLHVTHSSKGPHERRQSCEIWRGGE